MALGQAINFRGAQATRKSQCSVAAPQRSSVVARAAERQQIVSTSVAGALASAALVLPFESFAAAAPVAEIAGTGGQVLKAVVYVTVLFFVSLFIFGFLSSDPANAPRGGSD